MKLTFDKYRIKTYDSNNLVVEHYEKHVMERDFGKVKKGHVTEKWKVLGYFGNLSHALGFLLQQKVIDSDAESIKELVDYLDNFKTEIRKIKL